MKYVYTYCDPRTEVNLQIGKYFFQYQPFYIGYGVDNRINHHLNEAKRFMNGEKFSDKNLYKLNVIKSILKAGLEPLPIKLEENLSNDEAVELETNLIETIGRRVNNTGPLTNITTGGLGGDTLSNHPKLKQGIRLFDHRGSKNSMYGRTGANNPKSKRYLVIHPDGKKELIHGGPEWAAFMKDVMKTSGSSLADLLRGKKAHHKFFQVFKLEKDDDENAITYHSPEELQRLYPKSNLATWK